MNMPVVSMKTTYLSSILLREVGSGLSQWNFTIWRPGAKCFSPLMKSGGLNMGMSRAEKAEVRITNQPSPRLPIQERTQKRDLHRNLDHCSNSWLAFGLISGLERELMFKPSSFKHRLDSHWP